MRLQPKICPTTKRKKFSDTEQEFIEHNAHSITSDQEGGVGLADCRKVPRSSLKFLQTIISVDGSTSTGLDRSISVAIKASRFGPDNQG
jgi:hypothetical protein